MSNQPNPRISIRTLIRMGDNSYGVTLPQAWVERVILPEAESGITQQAGPGTRKRTRRNRNKKKRPLLTSQLIVEDRDTSVIVSPLHNGDRGKGSSQRRSSDVITVEMEGLGVSTLWNYLMALYRQGHDTVRVTYDPTRKTVERPDGYLTKHHPEKSASKYPSKQSQPEAVRAMVNRFPGWRVREERTSGGKGCVIVTRGNPKDDTLQDNLEDMLNLIEVMFVSARDFMRDCGKLTSEELDERREQVHAQDTRVDMFHDIGWRVIHKNGGLPEQVRELALTSLFILELLADEFKHIAIHLTTLKRVGKGTIELAENTHAQFILFRDFLDGFKMNLNKELERKLDQGSDNLYELHKKLLHKSNARNGEPGILSHLNQIAKKINALTELKIQMFLSR